MKYIHLSDVHLRDTVPVNRTDNYIETQERKFRWVLQRAQDLQATILIAGDLFDVAKPSPFLIAYAIRIIKDYKVRILVAPGNHDLPFHRMAHLKYSGLPALEEAGCIQILTQENGAPVFNDINLHVTDWDDDPIEPAESEKPNVLITHRMIIDSELFPGQSADYGKTFLRKNRLYQLIHTGDNHQTIVFEAGKRILCNPGSMMRARIDQIEHRPCIGVWDSEALDKPEERFHLEYIPIEPGHTVLQEDKVAVVKERNEKLQEFVQGLKSDTPHITFDDNLKSFLANNEIEKPVREYVWGAVGGERNGSETD